VAPATEDVQSLAPVCQSIVDLSYDLILDAMLGSVLPPVVLMESTDTFGPFVDMAVHEVYDRYIKSQRNLPLQDRSMPEAGKS
jgi:hypothetical protein